MSINQTNILLKGCEAARDMTSVLTSWKDIGKYLGKGTRTVQRWEKELALPVRRTKQGSKSVVLAIPAEINAWVQSQRFPDGQLDSVESERTRLFRTLKELRSENRELRSENRELRSENRELQRQLALERARVSVPRIA
jgi:hypothetical protein